MPGDTVVGRARIELRPDVEGFDREAERGIGGSLKKLALLAGGIFAGVQVAKFLTGTIAEAEEARKALAQTAAVIKSTGGVANVSAGDVDKLATSISNMTGIDDEAIAGAQNMLLTFKNVRNEVGAGNDVFNQATQA